MICNTLMVYNPWQIVYHRFSPGDMSYYFHILGGCRVPPKARSSILARTIFIKSLRGKVLSPQVITQIILLIYQYRRVLLGVFAASKIKFNGQIFFHDTSVFLWNQCNACSWSSWEGNLILYLRREIRNWACKSSAILSVLRLNALIKFSWILLVFHRATNQATLWRPKSLPQVWGPPLHPLKNTTHLVSFDSMPLLIPLNHYHFMNMLNLARCAGWWHSVVRVCT